MRLPDFQRPGRGARALLVAGLAVLALVATNGAGVRAESLKPKIVGTVTSVVSSQVTLGKQKLTEGRQKSPLLAGSSLRTNADGLVYFTIFAGNKHIDCYTKAGPDSNGWLTVQPSKNVPIDFRGGRNFCTTPVGGKHQWRPKARGANLLFSDPVFEIIVGKGGSVVKVRRGVVIVSGTTGLKTGVVIGRNQQAAVTTGSTPTPPTTISLNQSEQALLGKLASSLPPIRDKTAPVTRFDSGPHQPTSSIRTANFGFTAGETGVTFSCSLDGGDFHLCTSPQHYDGLGPGPHKFAVKAADPTGNTGLASYKWEVDSSRILFESARNGNPEIYVMDPVADPTGKNATDLTNNASADQDPAWSPDRKRIAFHSNRFGNKSIWVMNADGSSPLQVTRDKTANNTNPTWSPDGKLIAYESNATGQREIYVTAADGTGNPIQLTSNRGVGPDANFDPAWSPRGNQIAFASTRDGNYEIYIMNADGSGEKRLTSDPAVEFNPAWSPDGSLIAFHSDANRSSKQIWVMKPDGSDAHRVVSTAAEDTNPAWAPDGAELAFQSGPPGGNDLWIVGVDGTGLTQLTFTAGDDTVPDWR